MSFPIVQGTIAGGAKKLDGVERGPDDEPNSKVLSDLISFPLRADGADQADQGSPRSKLFTHHEELVCEHIT